MEITTGNYPIQSCYTFEFSPTNDIIQNIMLPDIHELRGKKIIRLDFHKNLSISPANKTVQNLNSLYINLLEESGKYLYYNSSYKPFDPYDNYYNRELINKIFSFPKSFLREANPAILSPNKAYVMTAYYNDNKIKSLTNKQPIKCQTIEVLLDDANKRSFNFPSNETKIFKGKKIRYINLYKPYKDFVSGNEVIAPSGKLCNLDYSRNYLNIVDKTGKTVFYNLPVYMLESLYQRLNDRITLDDIEIDFEKTNIVYPSNSVIPANRVIVFQIYYTE